ncbi:MFS transporter [Amycolatopsis sp. lyj-109]|uniref:MFS transporter n=1 Tax=Amycolatopsis sp. lyj-109 TaxID=2789287 RepID=UPI0039793E44
MTQRISDAAGPAAPDPRRWTALLFVGVAQLMVILDATIVNIALPHVQDELHFSDANRQWVVTAYSLAFGGLLLLGGRLSDLWGRKRAFIIGLIGFALASALGGAAVNTGMLLGARALQGVFGAVLAPAALSLVTVTFTEARERAKAFGIFSAIAGGGGAVGLILGGVLTQFVDWRWCLFVNIIFAVVAIAGAAIYLRDREAERNRDRLDLPGTLLGSAGIVALVYGFTKAEEGGWGAGLTIGLFAVAAVLLAAFVLVESRTRAALLPLRVVADRNRGGAYLAVALGMMAMFAQFLFLTYQLQLVIGFSPLASGFAFLPLTVCLIIGSTQIGARLVTRVPARVLMVTGFLASTVAMLLLTQLGTDTSYWALILPAEVLLGLGMGTAFAPGMNLATRGVRPQDAGVASAMLNTSQQVGGSIGTALLNTVAAGATTAWLAGRTTASAGVTLQGAVHGYTVAFAWCAGILALAALISAIAVNAKLSDDNQAARPGRPAVHV